MHENLSYSLRSRLIEKGPGPGKYDPKADYILEKSPSVALGKSEKKFESDVEKNNKNLPGPGSYSKPTTLTGPKWGFGSSLRAPEKEKIVPGPGAYNI